MSKKETYVPFQIVHLERTGHYLTVKDNQIVQLQIVHLSGPQTRVGVV